MNTRTLAYKFHLRPRRGQRRRLGQYCGAARYAWNWGLAEYESALDIVRARSEDDEDTRSIRDILQERMEALGLEVSRRGDTTKTLSLNSILYKLWCHHRDTEAPQRVREATRGKEGGHSHVGSYPLQRLVATIQRWWKAEGNRGPWRTSSERRAAKKPKWKKKKKKKVGTVGPPRYKRREDSSSFTIQAPKKGVVGRNAVYVSGVGKIYVDDRKDQNPMEIIPEGAVQKLITVREIAGEWHASVCVTEPWEERVPDPDLPACGIDLGMNAEATVMWSDGRIERHKPPMPLARLGVGLVLLQQKLSRSKHVLRCMSCAHEMPLGDRDKRIRVCKQPVDGEPCGGRVRRWRSNRGMRIQRRLAKLHARIARIRADHLHKLTIELVEQSSVICTEPHNITGLVSEGVAKRCEKLWRKGVRRKDIRRAMLDIGWGAFREQLRYKSEWYGADYVTLPEYTASDKMCWNCQYPNKMPNNTSEYQCAECAWEGTRQENTARLCLAYVGYFPGNLPGQRRGGDLAAGRKSGPAERTSLDSRTPGVHEDVGIDTTPGGQKPPGGSRKNSRKVGDSSRQEPRV